jgi:acetyl-CoA acetyltransferase
VQSEILRTWGKDPVLKAKVLRVRGGLSAAPHPLGAHVIVMLLRLTDAVRCAIWQLREAEEEGSQEAAQVARPGQKRQDVFHE